MDRLGIDFLPVSLPNKVSWPWTEECAQLPGQMLDGTKWPRISIITPSYNQGQFLEETIRSVLLQGYPNLEYIIIDGGSTDHSVDIIQRYQSWLTYWISEPDKGQAHAINKGFNLATGEIFNWINSDDLLAPGALAAIAQAMQGRDAVAGQVINFSEGRQAEELVTSTDLSALGLITGSSTTVFHQPGLWLQREQVAACGGIDERYHYAFDTDLVIRYLCRYPNVVYVPQILAHFRLHSASKTVSQQQKFDSERIEILQKLRNAPGFPELHTASHKRLRQIEWWQLLNRIMNQSRPAAWKAFQIALAACRDPQVRLNRLTAGLIRQLLLQKA